MKIEPVVLEGTLVRLEPLSPVYVDRLVEAALSALSIFEFFPMSMNSNNDLRERLALADRLQAMGAALTYVTLSRTTNELLGSTTMLVTDALNPTVEIGATWLLPRFQRSGANTETKYLQLRHAFEVMGVRRIEFKTDSRNEKSRRALARIGAKEEGTLRSHMRCWDGYRRDSVYFSTLDHEWPEIAAHLNKLLGSRPVHEPRP